MRVGVVTFRAPSTTSTPSARSASAATRPVALWHGDHDLPWRRRGGAAGRVLVRRLPALRRDLPLSPVMTEVIEAAGRGLPVLGICNGFQILCESHLLPAR